MTQTKPQASVVLLSVTAFLLPIIGGNLYFFDNTHLESGYASLVIAIFSGHEAPAAANLIAVLGALITVVLLTVRRRVVQVPDSKLSISLALFFFLIVASVAASSYRLVSLGACANWLAYGLVFFAAASGSGRVRGPVAILGALSAGCTFSALIGIAEWSRTVATDPTWRIFANWQNPNALAGMLAIGLVVSAGLLACSEGRAALLYGLATALNGFALYLTQSRGGLIAAFIGVVWLLIYLALRQRSSLKKVLPAFAIAVALCGTAIVVSRSHGGTVGGRIAISSSATEQSAGFRKLLWRGALQNIEHNPIGTGIGAYVYSSSRSGLTDQTYLAHNTLLQLGVEATAIAPVALLAIFFFWGKASLAGKRLEPSAAILRVAVAAAVIASLVDGIVDSNFYFFGIGASVFLLLGVGLQLGADGVSPEVAPSPMRRALVVGCVAVFAMMSYNAYRETVKAHAWYDIATPSASQAEDLSADLAAVKTVAAGDGEAHELLAHDPTLTPDTRLAELKIADDLEPSSKHAREVSDFEMQAGKTGDAIATLNGALQTDPYNFATLDRLLKLERDSGQTERAIETAKRIVDIEKMPIYQVRAISEVIPLSTARARAYLASQEREPQKLDDLLEGAATIYVAYADQTVPYMKKLWGPEGQAPSTLPDRDEVIEALTEGHDLVKALAVSYRNQGRSADATRAEGEATEIASVLAGLGGDK
jgi:O-antigen ligase/tetratricopeptide (TPR) repeat protein